MSVLEKDKSKVLSYMSPPPAHSGPQECEISKRGVSSSVDERENKLLAL